MSHAADSLTSTETQDTPGYEEKPPPYSAAPAIYLPAKTHIPRIYQPNYGLKTFWGVDPETSSGKTQDKTEKRVFVRKVSMIVALQLLFTVTVMYVFFFSGGEETMQSSLCIVSFIIFIVVASLLSCNLFRRHLWNTVGLVVVTLSLSHMVGTIASFHDTTAVVITMGATLAISAAITAFLANTSGFTVWSGVLLMLTVDMIMFGFVHLLLLLRP